MKQFDARDLHELTFIPDRWRTLHPSAARPEPAVMTPMYSPTKRLKPSYVSPMITAVVALGTVCCTSCAPIHRATEHQLRMRSAFDLACPYPQLQAYRLDYRTVGVVGCGRRLTYVESCASTRGEQLCTWILDSPPSLPSPQSWAEPVASSPKRCAPCICVTSAQSPPAPSPAPSSPAATDIDESVPSPSSTVPDFAGF